MSGSGTGTNTNPLSRDRSDQEAGDPHAVHTPGNLGSREGGPYTHITQPAFVAQVVEDMRRTPMFTKQNLNDPRYSNDISIQSFVWGCYWGLERAGVDVNALTPELITSSIVPEIRQKLQKLAA